MTSTLIPGDDAPPLLNERAGLNLIRQTAERSLTQAGPATRWLFYFAGHGLAQAGQGYLVPVDATAGRPDTFLPLRWLLDTCLTNRCGELLIVLDACYSGQALLAEAQLSDQIPAQGDSDRVRQIITSGNPDQPVLNGAISASGDQAQTLAALAETLRRKWLVPFVGAEVGHSNLALLSRGPVSVPLLI